MACCDSPATSASSAADPPQPTLATLSANASAGSATIDLEMRFVPNVAWFMCKTSSLRGVSSLADNPHRL
jgi:hypothetical protein